MAKRQYIRHKPKQEKSHSSTILSPQPGTSATPQPSRSSMGLILTLIIFSECLLNALPLITYHRHTCIRAHPFFMKFMLNVTSGIFIAYLFIVNCIVVSSFVFISTVVLMFYILMSYFSFSASNLFNLDNVC